MAVKGIQQLPYHLGKRYARLYPIVPPALRDRWWSCHNIQQSGHDNRDCDVICVIQEGEEPENYVKCIVLPAYIGVCESKVCLVRGLARFLVLYSCDFNWKLEADYDEIISGVDFIFRIEYIPVYFG